MIISWHSRYPCGKNPSNEKEVTHTHKHTFAIWLQIFEREIESQQKKMRENTTPRENPPVRFVANAISAPSRACFSLSLHSPSSCTSGVSSMWYPRRYIQCEKDKKSIDGGGRRGGEQLVNPFGGDVPCVVVIHYRNWIYILYIRRNRT